MAVTLTQLYTAARVFTDAFNPDGTFKDSTSPGALDGTPSQYGWAREMWAFLEILLGKAGIAHSGSLDTATSSQRYDALVKLARDFWPVWDSAHTYAKGAIVLASDDKTYQSLQAGNLNHDPVAGDPWWKEFAPIVSATTSLAGVSPLRKRVIIANSFSTPATVIDFSDGVWDFDDGSGSAVALAYAKDVSLAWAPGTAGGLDTGAVSTNTWYYCYAIYNPADDLSDYLFTASFGSPVLPSGYTKKRYVGAIRTGATTILPFEQTDKYFYWKSEIQSYNSSIITLSAVTIVVNTPDLISTLALLNAHHELTSSATTAEQFMRLFNPAFNDDVPTEANSQVRSQRTPTWKVDGKGAFEVLTDSSAQINIRLLRVPPSGGAPAANNTIIGTRGWIDLNLED